MENKNLIIYGIFLAFYAAWLSFSKQGRIKILDCRRERRWESKIGFPC